MLDKFAQVFSGPASFYQLISYRQKENPLFLRRHRRNRRANIVTVHLNSFVAQKLGFLIVAVVTANNEGKVIVLKDSIKEIQVTKGSKLQSTTFQFAAPANDCMLVVLFKVAGHQEKSTNALNAINELISKYFCSSHQYCAVDNNTSFFNIIELLPKARRSSVKLNERSSCDDLLVFRSRLWPLNSGRNTVILSSKMYSGFPAIRRAKSKSDHSIDVEISWDSSNYVKDLSITPTTAPDCGVYFHYLFKEVSPQEPLPQAMVERRSLLECPWCSYLPSSKGRNNIIVDTISDSWSHDTNEMISSLVSHLQCCHYHCKYEVITDYKNNLHVIIRRNRKHDVNENQILLEKLAPFFYLSPRDKPQLAFDLPKLDIVDFQAAQNGSNSTTVEKHVSLPVVVNDRKRGREHGSDLESGECKPKIATSLLDRQFYHARVGLPMLQEEMNYDSEEENDEEWESFKADRALEEFEDVSFEEKEFMKLWNGHIRKHPPYSSAYLPHACQQFVRNHGKEIIEANLRHNFVLHLMGLYDFCLLLPEEIRHLVGLLDQLAASISITEETESTNAVPIPVPSIAVKSSTTKKKKRNNS